jgi:hypothetical protein
MLIVSKKGRSTATNAYVSSVLLMKAKPGMVYGYMFIDHFSKITENVMRLLYKLLLNYGIKKNRGVITDFKTIWSTKAINHNNEP